jgi:hypothetical protein
MMEAGEVFETLDYLSELTQLVTWEHFINLMYDYQSISHETISFELLWQFDMLKMQ